MPPPRRRGIAREPIPVAIHLDQAFEDEAGFASVTSGFSPASRAQGSGFRAGWVITGDAPPPSAHLLLVPRPRSAWNAYGPVTFSASPGPAHRPCGPGGAGGAGTPLLLHLAT